MGKCTVTMPDGFLLKLSRLGSSTDGIVPKVLAAGAKVVEKQVRANLEAAVGHGTKYPSRSTGELVRSLGTSGARLDRDGNYNVKVGFEEKRPDGKRNAMLAAILEYGKHGQPPKPFLAPAKARSKKACIQAMEDELESEVKKI